MRTSLLTETAAALACRDASLPDLGGQNSDDVLDAESVVGHLIRPGSVFAFLAEHRKALFPDELFTDLFPSQRGRPSVPADVMASVIVLQTLHGMSDSETTDAITFDLRWKAAVRWPVTAKAFHDTTLTYWRRRLAGTTGEPAASAPSPGSCRPPVSARLSWPTTCVASTGSASIC